MENIKKFKNGNININISGYDDIDNFYNEVITMNDLYFQQVNGYMYLFDFNTCNAYDFSDCYINILLFLKEKLDNKKTLKLYPVTKKEYDSLEEDLNNGF